MCVYIVHECLYACNISVYGKPRHALARVHKAKPNRTHASNWCLCVCVRACVCRETIPIYRACSNVEGVQSAGSAKLTVHIYTCYLCVCARVRASRLCHARVSSRISPSASGERGFAEHTSQHNIVYTHTDAEPHSQTYKRTYSNCSPTAHCMRCGHIICDVMRISERAPQNARVRVPHSCGRPSCAIIVGGRRRQRSSAYAKVYTGTHTLTFPCGTPMKEYKSTTHHTAHLYDCVCVCVCPTHDQICALRGNGGTQSTQSNVVALALTTALARKSAPARRGSVLGYPFHNYVARFIIVSRTPRGQHVADDYTATTTTAATSMNRVRIILVRSQMSARYMRTVQKRYIPPWRWCERGARERMSVTTRFI